jgi:AcrR family transcriptional regulator
MAFGKPGSLDYLPKGEPKPRKPDGREVNEERRRRVRRAAAVLFAERGPRGVSRRQAADAARMSGAQVERMYVSDEALLGDVLTEFVYGLAPPVHAAFDAGGKFGPAGRLEAVIRAWLDYTAEHTAASRAFVLGLGQVEAELRESLTLKYWSVVETVTEALQAAVPELKTVSEGLKATMRGLLHHAWSWPRGCELDERGATARRIAGVLMAAGQAEARGDWPGLGPVQGVGRMGHRAMTCKEARARFSDLTDFVVAGGEVTVLRHGRAVTKVVGVVGQGDGPEAGAAR